MVINIYINYADESLEPMTEFQFRHFLEEDAIEMSADRKAFDAWVYINYTPTELLNLTESQRVAMRELWMDACRMEVSQRVFEAGWVEKQIEIPSI